MNYEIQDHMYEIVSIIAQKKREVMLTLIEIESLELQIVSLNVMATINLNYLYSSFTNIVTKLLLCFSYGDFPNFYRSMYS